MTGDVLMAGFGGQGMLLASVGPGLAEVLSLPSARANEGKTALSFGELEPLVGNAIFNGVPVEVERAQSA